MLKVMDMSGTVYKGGKEILLVVKEIKAKRLQSLLQVRSTNTYIDESKVNER